MLLAVDEAANAREVAAAARAAGSELGLLVEVDTGMHRAGVDRPEDAAALARVVAGLEGVRFEGLTGYEGHCSLEDDVAARTVLQQRAMGTLLAARDAVLAAGLPCPIVSAGGTRTWWLTASTPGVTEVQAGTYVVMDAFHSGLEGGFEHAVHIATTVISRAPGRLIVDVGSKTVAASELSRLEGLDLPVLRFDEEHGIFACDDRATRRHAAAPRAGLRAVDHRLVRRLPRRGGRPRRGHLAHHPAGSRARRARGAARGRDG